MSQHLRNRADLKTGLPIHRVALFIFFRTPHHLPAQRQLPRLFPTLPLHRDPQSITTLLLLLEPSLQLRLPGNKKGGEEGGEKKAKEGGQNRPKDTQHVRPPWIHGAV